MAIVAGQPILHFRRRGGSASSTNNGIAAKNRAENQLVLRRISAAAGLSSAGPLFSS